MSRASSSSTPTASRAAAQRTENADLFRLVCGGYGLFGVVHSATLRLDRRRKVERVVRLARADELEGLFAERIADGYLYGDFQFEIDPESPRFLQHGICSCYRPVPEDTPLGADHKLSAEDWSRLLHLAHQDKNRAYEVYAQHYLATSGQVYLSDRHQLATYVPGYHWAGSSEMITELYVPRAALADLSRRPRATCGRSRPTSSTGRSVSSSATTRPSSPGRASRGRASS